MMVGEAKVADPTISQYSSQEFFYRVKQSPRVRVLDSGILRSRVVDLSIYVASL